MFEDHPGQLVSTGFSIGIGMGFHLQKLQLIGRSCSWILRGKNSADMSNIEQILRAIDVPLQATVARRGLASRGKEV